MPLPAAGTCQASVIAPWLEFQRFKGGDFRTNGAEHPPLAYFWLVAARPSRHQTLCAHNLTCPSYRVAL